MPAAKAETVKAGELYRMLKAQDFRCAYSGRQLTPETASVDHVLPISRGGDNRLPNLAIIHMDLNAAKASMTLEEFVQMCRDVVAWQDQVAPVDVQENERETFVTQTDDIQTRVLR